MKLLGENNVMLSTFIPLSNSNKIAWIEASIWSNVFEYNAPARSFWPMSNMYNPFSKESTAGTYWSNFFPETLLRSLSFKWTDKQQTRFWKQSSKNIVRYFIKYLEAIEETELWISETDIPEPQSWTGWWMLHWLEGWLNLLLQSCILAENLATPQNPCRDSRMTISSHPLQCTTNSNTWNYHVNANDTYGAAHLAICSQLHGWYSSLRVSYA